MDLAIALRTHETENLFRNAMISALSSGAGDTAYLCSGFFQENHKGDPYQASNEGGLVHALARNHIKLITVGVYCPLWRPEYDRFVRNARRAQVEVKQLISPRWHAKVFILDHNGKSIFGIIGSSNMTKPAFSTQIPFNYECDVYLWDKNEDKLNDALSDLVFGYKTDYLIKSTYSLEENEQLSVNEKLKHIKNLLIEKSKTVD